MSTRTFLAVLRAARRQAALDLRAGVVGSGIALLVSVSAIVIVGKNSQVATAAHAAFGPMFLAGSIGTISCFITFQIAGEALRRPYRWSPAAGARPALRSADVGHR